MPVKSLSTLQTEQPKMGESSKMAEERALQEKKIGEEKALEEKKMAEERALQEKKMAEERAQQVQQGSSNSEVKKSGVV
jgi:hypothetical protein